MGLSQQGDEEVIDELENQSAFGELAEKANEIEKSEDPGAASVGFFGSMMDDMKKDLLAKFMDGNPIAKMERTQVRSMIHERLMQSKWKSFFDKNPKIIEFMTDVAHDEKALPSLVQAFNQPDKLKKYGFAVLVIVIIGFFLGSSKGNIFARIFRRLIVNVGVAMCSLATFYFFFQEEVSPTVDLFIKRFFS